MSDQEDEPRKPALWRRALARRHWVWLWIPFLVAVGALFLSIGLSGWKWKPIANFFAYLFVGGLLWFLVFAIVSFFRGRRMSGIASLICLVAMLASILPAAFFALVTGLTGSSEDGFADDLTIPEGLEYTEPVMGRHWSDEPGAAEDTFQAALRAALEVTEGDGAKIVATIPSLARLQEEHPALLQQFLAAHPGWRVYLEKGNEFATRRWMIGDQWVLSLHGYYSRFQPTPPDPSMISFQTRTTLGFTGSTWASRIQRIPAGETTATALVEKPHDLYESHLAFDAGGVLVELFEQGEQKERRLTNAAVSELEREFAALLEKPDWSSAVALLPPSAIEQGEVPSIELAGSSGIYNATVRCNPGESGRLYLKAFEVTREYPLSPMKLKERSNEKVGWSSRPNQLFLSETHFTIYEGDWEQYYAARFEVWFDPDSGAPERKLVERIFKIEGWMR